MLGTVPAIMHADLDAFYASVEQMLDPRLRGKPIAVGGGVVLAASYEARAFGVHGGMSGWQAKRQCPGLVFVGGHFREYQRLADEVMAVLGDFTPLIERVSIDEAFLDVTGSVRLFGSPPDIAHQIRARVRDEIGLPISVGVASTKHLAKIASQVAKPDGLVVVAPDREREFLDPLPVELIWGVGPVTRQRLRDWGIDTIGQLAAQSPDTLAHLLGTVIGHKLSALASNADPRAIDRGRRVGSVGAQSALGRRQATPELVQAALGHLADRVATRLRRAGRVGRTVSVRVRFADMRSVSRAVTLEVPTAATRTLTDVGVALVSCALADHPAETEITLIAVSVSKLMPDAPLQLELPFEGDVHDPRRAGSPAGGSRLAVDRTMDAVRAKFGRDSLSYAGVVFSELGGVPDEFRELAEGEVGDERRH